MIFEARALYALVFNKIRMFNDVGCSGSYYRTTQTGDSSSSSAILSTPFGGSQNDRLGKQQYTLSPNPSDGNIILMQAMTDREPVMAEIWNATGVMIFKQKLSFEGGQTGLRVINSIPGMYLLQLTDSRGNQFIIKFVINGN